MPRKAPNKPKRLEDEDNSFIKDTIETSIRLRSKDAEFYGLQRELSSTQKQMLQDFNSSKDIKHPRDVGYARENIFKEFLSDSGLMPRKYGVSQTSARVVAPTGHYSKELDVLLYDDKENIVLMRRNKAIEYYPIETSFGAIQIKSKLTVNEIASAFNNIASYKKLYRNVRNFGGFFVGGRIPSAKGFGIVFAYDSDLDWLKIHLEIKENANLYQSTEWPNVICVLSKGIFLFGDDKASYYHNQDLEKIDQLVLHGHPDRDGSCLFNVYSILMDLLGGTSTSALHVNTYYNLPQVSGDMSYEFALGPFAGTGKCPKHGEYLRKISETSLAIVVAYCRNQEPVNWIKAKDVAAGREQDQERYDKQPGNVLIYNPENLEWKDILAGKQGFITFDSINTEGMQIWIPYHYQIGGNLIEGCPSCRRETLKAEKRNGGVRS